MTQIDVADAAGLSDRTYADIERGSVNRRLETFVRICEVLHVTPDELLRKSAPGMSLCMEDLLLRLGECTEKERNTIMQVLDVCLRSLL